MLKVHDFKPSFEQPAFTLASKYSTAVAASPTVQGKLRLGYGNPVFPQPPADYYGCQIGPQPSEKSSVPIADVYAQISGSQYHKIAPVEVPDFLGAAALTSQSIAPLHEPDEF